MLNYHLTPSSESALIFSLSPPAELAKQRYLWAFVAPLQQLDGVLEVVVGMNNLTVFTYAGNDLNALASKVENLFKTIQPSDHHGKHIQIPVIYGGEFGPDLLDVAHYHHLTPQELVQQHTAPTYTVFMMGFQPGFPYLGGLPKNLHTPRRATPRTLVPAGSVGIGGSQTGAYPFASPGGWQLLGHTKLPLFQASNNPPALLSVGDTVQFVAQKVLL